MNDAERIIEAIERLRCTIENQTCRVIGHEWGKIEGSGEDGGFVEWRCQNCEATWHRDAHDGPPPTEEGPNLLTEHIDGMETRLRRMVCQRFGHQWHPTKHSKTAKSTLWQCGYCGHLEGYMPNGDGPPKPFSGLIPWRGWTKDGPRE